MQLVCPCLCTLTLTALQNNINPNNTVYTTVIFKSRLHRHLGLDSIKQTKLLSKDEFEKKINCKLFQKNVLVTFHPATIENKLVLEDQLDREYGRRHDQHTKNQPFHCD